MAKQQRLNKNLVAALTVSGIFLSVAVVGVASWNFSKRDPVALAQKAREQETAGNLPRAVEFWGRAWGVSRDPMYLVEGARCAYALGDVGRMIEMLRTGRSAASDNDTMKAVLESMLEKYLFLNPYYADDLKADLRDASADLLSIEPENVLALVARSEALSLLAAQDPSYPRLADEAYEKAARLAPSHPQVALLRYRRDQRKIADIASRHRGRQLPPEASAEIERLRADSIEALRLAAAAEPTHVQVVTTLAEELSRANDPAGSRELLEKAVAAGSESPRVLVLLAERLLDEALRGAGEGQVPASAAANAARARELAEKAVEREPAYTGGYRVLANCELVGISRNSLTPEDVERLNKAADTLVQALEHSVGVESLEAVLEERVGGRVRLITTGFDLATEFFRRAGNGPHRAAALARMKQFVSVATTERPESFMTAILEGELARHEGDPGRAIGALLRAEQSLRSVPGGEAWMTLVSGRLGTLYRETGEEGLALQYIEMCMRLTQQLGGTPDALIYVNKAELLKNAGKFSEALDVLDELQKRHPTFGGAVRLRIAVLSAAGRNQEADALLQKLGGESASEQFFTAYMHASRGNHEAALPILLRILDPNAAESLGARTGDALRMLASIAAALGKGEAALPVLRAHRERSASDDEKRLIDVYEIMLTTPDPAERSARILKLIEQIPDEKSRNSEFFAYYWQNEKYEEAARYLDLVEKDRPDDRQVLDQQFNLQIRLNNLERAEKYVAKLAAQNADRAGGAVYRAILRQAQKQFDAALIEYRAAEQALGRDSDLKVRIAQMLLNMTPPRIEDAQRELVQAVEYNPRNFLANKLLYAIYEQQGRPEEGVAYLKRAAELQPDDEYVARNKEFMDEELDPRSGVARREARRKDNPDDVDNIIRLGELNAKLAANPKLPEGERLEFAARVRECFAAAMERKPDSRRLARSVARFFTAQPDRARAVPEGLALLDRHVEGCAGLEQAAARVLRARYLENTGDAAAAESELLAVEKDLPALVADAESLKRAEQELAVEMVDFYSRARQAEKLVAACRKALTRIQDKALRQRLQLQAIEGLVGLQEFGRAREELDAYQKESPDDANGMRLRVSLILDEPQPSPEKRLEALLAAAEQLSRLLRLSGNDVWALARAGMVQLELARFHGRREGLTQARELLLKARELAPTGLNLVHRRALVQLYEVNGESDMAEKELRDLADLVPDDAVVANTLIDYLVAREKPDAAQEFVLARMRQQPDSPLWHYRLAMLVMRRGQHAAAVEHCRRAIALLSAKGMYDSAVEADLMRALNGSRQPRETVAFYEKRLADEPDAITPLTRVLAAEAYLAVGAPAQAAEAVRLAATESVRAGREAFAPFVAGSAVRLLGEKDGAEVLRGVIAQSANEPGVLILQVRLAGALSESADAASRADARKLLDDALARAPKGTIGHIEALFLAAQLSEKDRDLKAMQAHYEEILRHDPTNVRALNNLSYSLAEDMKNPAAALPYAERLHQITTRAAESGQLSAAEQASILDTVGWVYHLNQRDQQAEMLLADAMRLNPRGVEVRRHLGQVLASQNRKSEARRMLEAARELAQSGKDAATVEAIEKELSQLR